MFNNPCESHDLSFWFFLVFHLHINSAVERLSNNIKLKSNSQICYLIVTVYRGSTVVQKWLYIYQFRYDSDMCPGWRPIDPVGDF